MRNRHALPGPWPVARPLARGKVLRISADQRSRGDAAVLEGRGHVQPVRTIEGVSEGAKSRHGQHAIDDRCFVPPPFSARSVKRRVRLCEHHIRMSVGLDALDDEDMPVVVPRPNPRALKAGNLGRYVRCWRFHVELVRQRDDRFRIDRERLGLSVVHPAHQDRRDRHQQIAHVPPEAPPKSRSAIARWTRRIRALLQASPKRDDPVNRLVFFIAFGAAGRRILEERIGAGFYMIVAQGSTALALVTIRSKWLLQSLSLQ